MSRESGQRSRIRFGAVSAEVSIVKASTKPRASEHETRRVLVEQELRASPDPAALMRAEGEAMGGVRERIDHGPPSFETELRGPTTDPFGDPVAPPMTDTEARILRDAADAAVAPLAPGLLGPMGDPTWPPADVAGEADAVAEHEPHRLGLAERAAQLVGESETARAEVAGDLPPGSFERVRDAPTYVPPPTRVEQGVHLENGTWVDLTDRLEQIDARTKVDGLEVVRTIPASSYPSERVRECHYIAGVNPAEYKVLALLWRALRMEGKAAEVRWTKRTAQATGIILARGDLERPKRYPPHLVLLELEWAANMRAPSKRVTGPVTAEVGIDEAVAAVELVRSFAASAPREELRDERLAKRAELLELARAGQLAEYVPPVEPMPEDVGAGADGLAEALELAAAWNREHAPA